MKDVLLVTFFLWNVREQCEQAQRDYKPLNCDVITKWCVSGSWEFHYLCLRFWRNSWIQNLTLSRCFCFVSFCDWINVAIWFDQQNRTLSSRVCFNEAVTHGHRHFFQTLYSKWQLFIFIYKKKTLNIFYYITPTVPFPPNVLPVWAGPARSWPALFSINNQQCYRCTQYDNQREQLPTP